MNTKAIIFLCCLFWLGACSRANSPLPTRAPTAVPIIPLPPSDSSVSTETESEMTEDAANDPDEINTILQEIDLEVCQEVFETKAELDALQTEGKDVTELATAVAELAGELEYCQPLMTPTPNN